jgi:RNA polymerase sigma-70 factor (ECF subfamily)
MATEQATVTGQATISTQQAAALVALAQQGDQQAFATLYEYYRPLVYRFLRRRLDGADEAVEDLTEDVFVKLYEKLDRYVERGLPFTAWLYRIAHNQLVDYLRALPRLSSQPLEAVADVPESQTSSEYRSVLDRQTLEPALARLTPEQRQAVELRFLQGLSVAETAATMGRSEEAVKKLQARALANMRRHLMPAAQTPTPMVRPAVASNVLRMAVA